MAWRINNYCEAPLNLCYVMLCYVMLCYVMLCYVCADIQIGFTHGSYSFLEPSRSPRLITSVELVRDGGRQSEQTFEVQVSV